MCLNKVKFPSFYETISVLGNYLDRVFFMASLWCSTSRIFRGAASSVDSEFHSKSRISFVLDDTLH